MSHENLFGRGKQMEGGIVTTTAQKALHRVNITDDSRTTK